MMTNDRLELDWLAFQYIAGELTAAEAARFEERLAVDQPAREAVAAAVELAELAAVVADQPVELTTAKASPVSRVGWARRLAWMSCGAAACLALVVFVQQSGWGRLGDAAATNPRLLNAEAPELALAWAQARADADDDDAAEVAEAMAVDESRSEEDGIAAPSWMLAAVAGLGFHVEETE